MLILPFNQADKYHDFSKKKITQIILDIGLNH